MTRFFNRQTGWASLAAGIAVGLVMGLWSFDGPLPPPQWLGEYGDTSRRLARLGHIAFIGLGILNILLADELPRSTLGARGKSVASWLMIAGNALLPAALLAASAWRPVKYGLPVPAMCVFGALLMGAWGARRS